ncbi:MAG: methyltransferase domain-containing protein [Acidimicrobiaceae bacterium]|nr:methyltransferase domain-containing protein [Acidimicrobiaceae bacterium]
MPASDARILWESYLSPYWFPSLLVADELGVLSSLAQAPAGVDELSRRMDLNPRGVGAVLAMLASLGYVSAREGRYAVTDTTRQYVLPESPYYWGGLLVANRRNRFLGPLCDALRHALVTKDLDDAVPALSEGAAGNSDAWARGEMGLDAARGVAAYMHSHSATAAIGVAQNGDFSSAKRLLDVGGGSGVYSIEVAKAYPELRCTVLELASVCHWAEEYIERAGVADRVDTVALDMFRQAWPTGYDAVFFSNVFHDWATPTCLELAKRAFESLAPGGTINVHEMLLDDDGNGPREAAAFGVHMVTGTRGQHRSFTQLRTLFAEAGFVDAEWRSTSPLFSLVRAYKP